MTPIVRELDGICKDAGKTHHEWLQAWKVHAGREPRITAQGEILVRERPDAIYAWAYESQVGITESSDDPAASWAAARKLLEKAKEAG